MNGTLLLSYLGGVILMGLFALLVIFNFVRYRFKGDLTFFFIAIFSAAFVIISMGAILLTKSGASAEEAPIEQPFN